MAELVVVVPSRGRPDAAIELARVFQATCTADTKLVFSVDVDDPRRRDYSPLIANGPVNVDINVNTSMVQALNATVSKMMAEHPVAIGFMGDDHRPRTVGWDRAYLDALRSLPGIVYGNDLLQKAKLPTQCAISTSVVAALGHMAPPVLRHLYVDNYWRDLGRAAGRITYLPDVVVEHVHPATGRVAWDEGHRRVNDPAMYARDRQAFEAYMAAYGHDEILAVCQAAATVEYCIQRTRSGGLVISRADLVIEVSDLTDGSGDYVGEWVDSADVRKLFLMVQDGTSGVKFEFSSDGTTALATSDFVPANGAVIDIYARYFRLRIDGGNANTAFWAIGRVWDGA